MTRTILVLASTLLALASPSLVLAQDTARVSRVSREGGGIDDWVLENRHVRLTLRSDNLTITVQELATGTLWTSDLWENTAGRVNLRSLSQDNLSVGLASAQEKKIEPIEGAEKMGLRIQLANFKSRLGPVRRDRGIADHLSIELKVELAAARPEFTCRIERVGNTSFFWKLESIEWPLRLFPVRTVLDDGYIAVPQEQGFIIPSRFAEGHYRYLNWIWERISGQNAVFNQNTMPWLGVKKGNSAVIGIFETPDDVLLGVIANDVRPPGAPAAAPSAVPVPGASLHSPRLSAAWPIWQSSKGELAYPRAVRYTFLPNGGYVEMCKEYRRYAQQRGLFVTLKEKIKKNPLVEKLISAPHIEVQLVANRVLDPDYEENAAPVYDGQHHVHTTFDQVEAMVKDMKGPLGIDRALLLLAGFGKDGYDNLKPMDVFPVNAEAGGEAKLRRAIDAGKDAGYLIGFSDNYREIDLPAPSYHERYIMREANGALAPAFSSDGGHSQELCAREAVGVYKRNIPLFRAFAPNTHYLDTIGGIFFFECYDPRHPMTRSGDRESKAALLQASDPQWVLGVEGPARDWNLPLVAYYQEHPIRMGIDVPLYSLVYHECSVNYWQHVAPFNYGLDQYGHTRGTMITKFLRGLLYADPPSWVFTDRSYHAWRDRFKAINDVMPAHHRRLAHDELLDHKILSPDLLVQRTRFSSGVEVTVNYGEFPHRLEDGATLPAYGYHVRDSSPGGKSHQGRVDVRIAMDATTR